MAATAAPVALAQTDHFHPKGKPPSEHTIQVLQEARNGLPFEDDRDFEESDRGFIKGETGWIVFDLLVSAETARAAKELVDQHLETLPDV
jgi:alkyl sulfatase BDS1-like metallo-beta-lactamase superfamily hydrolase